MTTWIEIRHVCVQGGTKCQCHIDKLSFNLGPISCNCWTGFAIFVGVTLNIFYCSIINNWIGHKFNNWCCCYNSKFVRFHILIFRWHAFLHIERWCVQYVTFHRYKMYIQLRLQKTTWPTITMWTLTKQIDRKDLSKK